MECVGQIKKKIELTHSHSVGKAIGTTGRGLKGGTHIAYSRDVQQVTHVDQS